MQNLSLILITRSWSAIAVSGVRSPNPAFLRVFAGTLLCLSLVLCVPGLMDLFRFGPLSPFEILVRAGAGVLRVLWFEVYKYGSGWWAG
jgi:Ca2+-transporting ATPase